MGITNKGNIIILLVCIYVFMSLYQHNIKINIWILAFNDIIIY